MTASRSKDILNIVPPRDGKGFPLIRIIGLSQPFEIHHKNKQSQKDGHYTSKTNKKMIKTEEKLEQKAFS